METESQAHSVDRSHDRRKALPARGRGETVLSGHLAQKPIKYRLSEVDVGVLSATRRRVQPLDITDDILSVELPEVLCHASGIAQQLFLIDIGRIAIPIVPPHWRCQGDKVHVQHAAAPLV
jgi:hypothetical protein